MVVMMLAAMTTAEAHFSHINFELKHLDLLQGNNNFHSDYHRPKDDEYAYLDHMSEPCGCHLELLMRMVSMVSHLIARHTAYVVVLLYRSSPLHVCQCAVIAVLLVIHCHVDRMPNELLLIYCPANKVNNLNALMAVDRHSINHCSIQCFQFYP